MLPQIHRRTHWRSCYECQAFPRGWHVLLMSLWVFFFLHINAPAMIYRPMHLYSNEYFMEPDWPATPSSLIKSLWIGEVNYALFVVASINYSLGALQSYLCWQSLWWRGGINIQRKLCKAGIKDCVYLSGKQMYEMQMASVLQASSLPWNYGEKF